VRSNPPFKPPPVCHSVKPVGQKGDIGDPGQLWVQVAIRPPPPNAGAANFMIPLAWNPGNKNWFFAGKPPGNPPWFKAFKFGSFVLSVEAALKFTKAIGRYSKVFLGLAPAFYKFFLKKKVKKKKTKKKNEIKVAMISIDETTTVELTFTGDARLLT